MYYYYSTKGKKSVWYDVVFDRQTWLEMVGDVGWEVGRESDADSQTDHGDGVEADAEERHGPNHANLHRHDAKGDEARSPDPPLLGQQGKGHHEHSRNRQQNNLESAWHNLKIRVDKEK